MPEKAVPKIVIPPVAVDTDKFKKVSNPIKSRLSRYSTLQDTISESYDCEHDDDGMYGDIGWGDIF